MYNCFSRFSETVTAELERATWTSPRSTDKCTISKTGSSGWGPGIRMVTSPPNHFSVCWSLRAMGQAHLPHFTDLKQTNKQKKTRLGWSSKSPKWQTKQGSGPRSVSSPCTWSELNTASHGATRWVPRSAYFICVHAIKLHETQQLKQEAGDRETLGRKAGRQTWLRQWQNPDGELAQPSSLALFWEVEFPP